ncbi:penicillin acylase family protein [Agromyces sp. MMS24-JH15]|uniref:penicillin acylase family protein n=1 Tax=Agromyces sp. MMS24-JH15 TaxID=3243765 RepID=UPI0037481CE5
MGTDDPRTGRSRLTAVMIGVLVTVLVLALGATGFGWWTVTRSFPETTGQIDVRGLDAAVTVSRDAHGIPTVTAQTDHDLFFAQGFVHAQDRFWEMDFRRHVTAGRLAELFGESQVETDAFIRTLGWRTVAEAEYAMLDETTKALYDAYAEGVNAYLADRGGAELSLEYALLDLQNPGYSPEPWTAVDSVAWLKAMAWDLRSNLEEEIDRAVLSTTLAPEDVALLHPAYPYGQHPTIIGGAPAAPAALDVRALDAGAGASAGAGADDPATVLADPGVTRALAGLRAALDGLPELIGPAGGDIGSNSWAVSGALTDTGLPLLANDPHLGASTPSVWAQMGLRCDQLDEDCSFDVTGFTFSGVPGVIIGHNQQIAWGFTNLAPDVTDLYVERVVDDTFELDGQFLPMRTHEEVIQVAGGEPRTITVRATGRGPLLSDVSDAFGALADGYPAAIGAPEADYAVSLQWTALTPGTTPQAIFAIDRATTWDQFRGAAALFDVPAQNLLYADTAGSIGYQAPGDIPIRLTGDGTVPLPGWTSANGWRGAVDFGAMPAILNPERGYIVTANNAVQQGGPFLTADWDRGYRAAAIETLLRAHLDAGEQVTAEMMEEIQADTADGNAAQFLPVIASLTLDGDAAEGQRLLADWDGRDDVDSAEAAYFAVFWRTLLADMFADLPEGTEPKGNARWWGVMATLLATPDSHWWADPASGAVGRDAVIAAALDAAWDEAGERMGTDPANWRWGRLHTLTLENQSFGKSGIDVIERLFNRGPYEVSGGSSIVNATGWDASLGYEVHWVPSMRMVVDLDDFDRSRWINLTGASGHAFDPHYDDQTPLWQRNETLAWPYTAEAVGDAARDGLVLRPVG